MLDFSVIPLEHRTRKLISNVSKFCRDPKAEFGNHIGVIQSVFGLNFWTQI
jgi:hypothetical protein